MKWYGLVVLIFIALSALARERSIADDAVVNSIGMKLVRIEPGSFVMGSADGDWDECPAHAVTISRPFFLSVTEVTNAQY
jgi:formylglycine-generating enzyme required for sulfatase activity